MNDEPVRPVAQGAPPSRARLAIEGRRATLSLDAPPLNIFDFELIRDVRNALKTIRDQKVSVVVFKSALPAVFSSGVDVKIHTPRFAPRMLRRFHDLIRRIDAGDAVFIAEIDGVCLGGGFEFALICDFVIATPRSQFGFPEIDLGCFPPVAAALLPRIAPAAASMILTGRRIDAPEALRLGLITEIADDASAMVAQLSDELMSKSAHALARTRRAIRAGRRGSFKGALERVERLYEREILSSHDAAEGVTAFVEKRGAAWRHE